jgi:hypothetical protein
MRSGITTYCNDPWKDSGVYRVLAEKQPASVKLPVADDWRGGLSYGRYL